MITIKYWRKYLFFGILLVFGISTQALAAPDLTAQDFRSPFASNYHILHSNGPQCGKVGGTHFASAAIDLPGYINTPIYSSTSGIVSVAGWVGVKSYGNLVEIDAGNGYVVRYGHLSGFTDDRNSNGQGDFVVQPNQHVDAGQLIGFLGASGNVTTTREPPAQGEHLHFEILKDGVQQFDLIKNLSWMHWAKDQQGNINYCYGASVDAQAVSEPACNGRNFDGVIFFKEKYCQNEVVSYTNGSENQEFSGLSNIRSIYMGSGWSAKVSGDGGWRCVNSNMWDLSKDYYTSTSGVNMDKTINKVFIYRSFNCNGIATTPYSPIASAPDTTGTGGAAGTDGRVHLYSLADYAGTMTWIGGTGFSNAPNADSYSVEMPSGWSVKVWRGDNRSGEVRCFSSNVHNLQDHSWQLSVQSIEVFSNNVCGDAQTGYAVLCADTGCWEFGPGYHSLPSYGQGWNDIMTKIYALPSNMSVTLFREGGSRGTVECYNAPQDPLTNGWPHDMYKQVTDMYVATAKDCPVSLNGAVVLYDSKNFDSYKWSAGTQAGVVNMSNLGSRDFFNDAAESVRIPPDKSAVFYENDDRGGLGTSCLTGDQSDIGGLDNKVSSVEIFLNPNCHRPAPQPPTDLLRQSSDSASITIGWTAHDDTDGWHIYRWDGQSFALLTTINKAQLTFTDLNLPCDASQFYEVSAFNGTGDSARAGWIEAKTTACPAIPDLTVTAPPDGTTYQQVDTAQFKWEKLSKAYHYYVVIYQTGSEIPAFVSTAIDSDSYSFAISQLSNGAYDWGIVATPDDVHFGFVILNSSFTVAGASAPTVPSAPSSFVVPGHTQNNLTMTWQDNSNNEDGFKLYYWNGKDFLYERTLPANITSFTEDNLECGASQFYKLSSFNATGESGLTEFATGKTDDCPNGQKPDLCPGKTTDAVALFQHANCYGMSTDISGTGEHPNLVAPFDNFYSSVIVRSGFSALLFSEANFVGSSRCINASLDNFFSEKFGDQATTMNDNISSFKVFADNRCGVPVDTPQPDSPKNLQPNGQTFDYHSQPVFSWNPVNADSYHVVLVNETTGAVVNGEKQTGTVWTAPQLESGTYSWAVVAENAVAKVSSEFVGFTVSAKVVVNPPPVNFPLYLPLIRR